MLEKRKRHEIKIIVVLSVLILIIYGLAAILLITVNSGNDTSLSQPLNLGESVKKMTIESDAGTYHLERGQINWQSPDADGIPLNQVTISNMTDLFTGIEADRVIEDGSSYFSQFGLETPQYRITVSGDSMEKVYLIGDLNYTLGQYYVAIEGEPQVYLIAQSDVENTMKTLLQLVDDPELSDTQSSEIISLDVNGTEGRFTATLEDDVFVFESDGERYEGDAYSALDVYYSLKNLAYTSCVSFDASDAELDSYGLQTPDIVIGFRLTDTDDLYLVKIGQGEDGNYYLSSGNDRIVYQITEEEYDGLNEDTQLSNLIE